MTIVRYFLLFMLTVIGLFPQDGLTRFLEEAAKNNSELKAQYQEYLAARETVIQAGALPDPQLMAGFLPGPVETRNGPQRARISLTQMFPWFGTLSARKKTALERAAALYEQYLSARDRLFLRVKSVYFDLYLISRNREITVENQYILDSYHNLILARIQSGRASTADALQVDMARNDMKEQLARLDDRLTTAQLRLITLLNRPFDRELDAPQYLPVTEVDRPLDEIWKGMLNGNHQLAILEHMERSWDNRVRSARLSGLPNISLGIDYMVVSRPDDSMSGSHPGRDAIAFPVLGLSIPLQRGRVNAMVKESAYRRDAVKHAKRNRINELRLELEETYRHHHEARRRILLNVGQIQLAERSLKILETAYETEGGSFDELLRMNRQLLTYRFEMEQGRVEREASAAKLAYLTSEETIKENNDER